MEDETALAIRKILSLPERSDLLKQEDNPEKKGASGS